MPEFVDILLNWPFRKLPDEYVFLGLPMFWWSRIGGLLQFLAASFVIAEIIGEQTIRKYCLMFASFSSSYHINLLSLLIFIPNVLAFLADAYLHYSAKSTIPLYIICGFVIFWQCIILYRLIGEMVIYVLSRPALDRLAKISSFVFVVVGTLLQMLAA